MKILVTGSNGFIGKNFIEYSRSIVDAEYLCVGRETSEIEILEYIRKCDFIMHFAGVNRPDDPAEFKEGNRDFTELITSIIISEKLSIPILFTSSAQAELDNPYGLSKKGAEDVLVSYSKAVGADVYIYRLPNVFGKWSKPNYNSAIATFCYNIANDLPITLNDRNTRMKLVYIDDVVKSFVEKLSFDRKGLADYYTVDTFYETTLGEIADYLYSFRQSRNNLIVPNVGNQLVKKLYSTYLSFISTQDFSYSLVTHSDDRGSFTELFKSISSGQVSVNVSKPGITKGNHWHHTKNEKFVVVSGHGVIKFRKIGSEDTLEYYVSGDDMRVVDIPVGYTHNITNLGDENMITVMWVNELFDPEQPDTYFLEV